MPSQKKAEYLPQEAEAADGGTSRAAAGPQLPTSPDSQTLPQAASPVASTTPAASPSTPALVPVAVHFEGPEPDQDSQGEEVPIWFVFAAADTGDPTSRIYRCSTYSAGWGLAQRMAHDRRLQLINEAQQA